MGVIVTSDARCRDCYKCVRHCPIKAIRVADGHAEVWDERCIYDGACLNVCPQEAKQAASHLERVEDFLQSGYPVVVSLAPSFAAIWPGQFNGLAAALRDLGFYDVQETAVVASQVAHEHVKEREIRRQANGPFPLITSSCPAVVSLVEKHYPQAIELLADVVSPMIAHGRLLKQQFAGAVRVVFIGPCVAKKDELALETHHGAVDAALTFSELKALGEKYDVAMPGDSSAPAPRTLANPVARLFPLEGGLLRTADVDVSMMGLLSGDVRLISGIERCMAFLEEGASQGDQAAIVELLACESGCIGGPFMDLDERSRTDRQNRVLNEYQTTQKELEAPITVDANKMKRRYRARRQLSEPVGEEQLALILSQMGKEEPEDHLNCGACGYDSCREKAFAVYQGAAEVEMCIPHMRKRAESLANVIMHEMPNGVIVTDRDLRIVSINPAVEHMFHCRTEQMKGRKLGYLIDPKYFRQVLQARTMAIVDVDYPSYNLQTKQYIFHVKGQDLVIGIFVDISREEKHKRELQTLQKESVIRAQEVIDKQMRVAQEIAGLMGETTAETKTLLTQLMQVIQNEPHSDT